MIRKIAALMVVAIAALMLPLTSSPAHAAYGPKLPTKVHIKVDAQLGKPLVVTFSVTASDGTSPAGDLTYTINRAGGAARGAARVAARTNGSLAVSGSPVTVNGQVARAGHYVVSAHFSPSNSAKYLPSSNTVTTAVSGEKGQNNNNGGGGLPNTGGPDLGWLVAGLVLAGAGAGAVTYSRRRTAAAA